jgi:hypothetical protein
LMLAPLLRLPLSRLLLPSVPLGWYSEFRWEPAQISFQPAPSRKCKGGIIYS